MVGGGEEEVEEGARLVVNSRHASVGEMPNYVGATYATATKKNSILGSIRFTIYLELGSQL